MLLKQSSRGVLRIFPIFTGKHLRGSVFFNELASLTSADFFRTPILYVIIVRYTEKLFQKIPQNSRQILSERLLMVLVRIDLVSGPRNGFQSGGAIEHWKVLSTTMVGRQENFSNSRRSRMAKTIIF